MEPLLAPASVSLTFLDCNCTEFFHGWLISFSITPLGSAVLSLMAGFPSFLKLNNIPLF
jgi:hypothetical protein